MCRKFTLIELLIVIAIIGILASMLLPALANAREKVKIAVEVSNRKQLMVATTLYADDNSSLLPDRDDTFQDLHTVNHGGRDNNIRLLEAYCGSKDYDVREKMLFCDSTLNKVRNQQTAVPNYSYDNAKVQYNNPGAGIVLIPDFTIKTLEIGEPDNAVWNCMSLVKNNVDYFGHDTPIIESGFQKGASTAFLDGAAQWMRKETFEPFYMSNNNTFFIPLK